MKKSRITGILFKLLFFLFIFGFLCSCNGDDGCPSQQNNPNEDVYVAGGMRVSGMTRATYWKNGVPITLNEGTRASMANDIFIKGSDIYVVGYVKNEQYEEMPALWINGAESLLNIRGASGMAYSVFVADKIYIGGYESNGPVTARLWVSGNSEYVTPLNEGIAEIRSIYVDQNKVYLAGYEYEGNNKIAKYWIYDSQGSNPFEEFTLDQQQGQVNDNVANSIVVKNNKIYIAGRDDKGAVLWTNNVPTRLYPDDPKSLGQSIFIKNNDIYVAGISGDQPTNMAWYWKNGELTNLSRGDGDLEFANSIAVGEENIYVVGSLRNSAVEWATLWTNNTPEDLTKNKTNSWANSVKIVKK